MSFETERKNIETRFKNNFDSSIVAVQYENVPTLKKGTKTIKDFNTEDKFVRLSIDSTASQQIDVGGDADRFFGLITVGIFTKENIGTNLARKLVDELFSVYHRQTFDGIVCRETQVTTLGATDGYYQINLNTEFYRDERFILPIKLA